MSGNSYKVETGSNGITLFNHKFSDQINNPNDHTLKRDRS